MHKGSWHSYDLETVFEKLDTRIRGLTDNEAAGRLVQYGYNELEEKKKESYLHVFLRQFKSPIIYVLIVAAVVAFLLREYDDAVIIAVILTANAIIGSIQEGRAERAISSLKKLASPVVKVKRKGVREEIPSREVVPGDVIIIETGDRIPADARVIERVNLKIDEAVLTGESVASEKYVTPVKPEAKVTEQKNMVFSGTQVVAGHGEAVVVATGVHTQMGEIARTVQEAEEDIPIMRRMAHFSRWIIKAVVFVMVFTLVIGLIRAYPLYELFLVVLSQLVSAIPEGLPVALTVVLSIGMYRMAKRNVLIRRLAAIETLGSVTAICTDKTGTLTRNEMTVTRAFIGFNDYEITGVGFVPEGTVIKEGEELDPAGDETFTQAVKIGGLCNNAKLYKEGETWRLFGDPTEGALVVLAYKAGIDLDSLNNTVPRIFEIPFDSASKLMVTLHSAGDKNVVMVKGALEQVLALCGYLAAGEIRAITSEDRTVLEKTAHEYGKNALRVIALAYQEVEREINVLSIESLTGKLILAGIVGMMDPPRDEVVGAMKKCYEAGITPIMITGDHLSTAMGVARKVGMRNPATIQDIEKLSDEELQERIKDTNVFARVLPEQKLRIVNALKANKQIVAMTGDGVNDVPALANSNVSIAMGIKGTDAAKDVSHLVLADDNFASIVAGVEEGRGIKDNIKKAIYFLLSTNFGEIVTLIIALLIGLPLPLVAAQILWINMVTDGVIVMPLITEPKEKGIMKRRPSPYDEPFITTWMVPRIVLASLVMGAGSISLFYYYWATSTLELARAVVFTTLVVFQWFNALNARSFTVSLFGMNPLSNRNLLIGLGIGIILQIGVIYLPFMQPYLGTVFLGMKDWIAILAVSSTVLIATEIYKYLVKRKEV
ncbi:MAG: HAD-IC family P-type ATPase [Methanophagales archaeon]|nr:HAD-IC family P-type ATPase [Methanophagales archaeon]